MRRRLTRLFSTSRKPSVQKPHLDESPPHDQLNDKELSAPKKSPTTLPPIACAAENRSSEDWLRSMLDTYGMICSSNEENQVTPNDLTAALEHSRRVMTEEKHKFQLLWQPCVTKKPALSFEPAKISPLSGRTNGGGLSAAMIFREGPINESLKYVSTATATTHGHSNHVQHVGASPLTHRSSGTGWPASISAREALLIKDPKLSRLLRAHRHTHANGQKSRRRQKAFSEHSSGHKRARSSPEINWGGAIPTPIKRVSAESPSIVPTTTTLSIPHLKSAVQIATSPSAANISPYAATDTVSPLAGAPTFFREIGSRSRTDQVRGDESGMVDEIHEASVARDISSDEMGCIKHNRPVAAAEVSEDERSISPSNQEAVKPSLRLPLHIDLPSRNNEINLERHGYTMVSFLAEGSLGKLHIVKGENETLWVAKLVDLALLRNPAEAAEALLEAELLRRLRHPNIVEYRNSFIEDEHLVIIMEYCVRGDLHSHLCSLKDRNELVPEPKVFHWVHDICSGLSHMHQNNVLHCDVKSSNVFLDANLVAKIGDLGIAKEIRRGARALSPLRCPRGTPLYMSPEMCQKAALTERSDCWAVGCILYEICNLHHAFGSNLHINRPIKDNESVQSGHSGATFLPGVTNRSDLSFACKRMLKNIRGDLRRIKHQAVDMGNNRQLDADILRAIHPPQELHYWSKGSLSFPQILPAVYCPLLNYMVCAMLEPRPSDRPTLSEILQLVTAAMEEAAGADDEDSVPEEGITEQIKCVDSTPLLNSIDP